MDVIFNFIILFIFHTSLNLIEAYDRQKCPTKVRTSRHYIATDEKTCYMFVNQEKYWDEARSYCWDMGGEMLYIQNHKTMNFIKSVLNSRELGWSKNGVWNGASDLRGKGWEWTTGKSLSYKNWGDGEPSSFLGIISVENCACMRRSDDWKWHDFHCHWSKFEYNFICQFPMEEETTYTGQHVNTGAPLTVEKDDKLTIIGLIVGGVLLLVIVCAIVYYLNKKHVHQRREFEKRNQRMAARFQNTGYATIMQDISHDPSHNGSMDVDVNQSNTRPVSNIYLDPVEIDRVYDVVNKDTSLDNRNLANLGSPVDSQNVSNVSETAPLVYTGGASSAGNLAGIGANSTSEAAGATSGYCTPMRRAEESEYIEMSGGNSMNSMDNIGTVNGPTRCSGGSSDNLKNLKSGATGSVQDLKSSNIYVTPVHYDSKLNNSSQVEKPKSPEIHIYSNRLDEIENNSLLGVRPLPPVPNMDNNSVLSEKMVS